jgi:hypothetical protein
MTLAYVPAEDGLLHCAAAQDWQSPFPELKKGLLNLWWSQGDSNP